jgi:hypothetical protein
MGDTPRQRQLGEILVDTGVLSEDELGVVLAEHQRTGRMLGELVVSLGLATSRAITDALASQKGWAHDSTSRDVRERVDSGGEPDGDRSEQFHRLFLPTAEGYQMITRSGPAPEQGTVVEIQHGETAMRYEVVKRSRTLLPDRACQCAHLQPT